MDSATRRVAIIGGGLSGLATACQLRLLDPGIHLTLYEASDRVGGVIHTERVGDFVIDHGADMFSANPDAALKLCEQLGVEDQLIEPKIEGRGARIVKGGKLIPLPEGFVLMRATQLWPMITTPLLSLHGKIRFLMERWISSDQDSKDDNPSREDESVASFVRRRMGQELLDQIVAPLSAGIYTADINKLSMHATMGPIAKMEREYGSLARATAARRRSGQDSVERSSAGARYSQFRAFRGGMIELISTLAGALPSDCVRLGNAVESLDKSSDQWEVTCGEKTESYDHVIVAVPPKHASRLLAQHVPEAAEELSGIESASAAIAVLVVRRADIKNDINMFGFVVPLTEGRRILAGSFASNKFAGRAPDDHVIVRVFMGGAMQPELLQNSDEELVQIAREELADLIGLSGEPVVHRLVRWNNAMPQYHVGHLDRVARIESAMSQTHGLSLMTNALHGVGIAPVIKQAGKVASDVVAELKKG